MTATLDTRTGAGATDRHAHALRTTIGAGTRLFVAEVNDVDYVTNSYWLAPVAKFSALWAGTPEHGTWELEANAKTAAINYVSENVPALNTIVTPDQLGADQEILWADLDGRDVYTADGAKMFYRDNTRELEAVNLDYVRLLAGEKRKHSDSWDDSVWRIVVPADSKKNTPVTVQRALKSISIKDGAQTHWVFAGILMPVRVS
jgi:hypothetical protein